MNDKNYVIKWKENKSIVKARDGIHYLISFEEGNMIEQSLSKDIYYFYFSGKKDILKSTKVIKDALYMSYKEANYKLGVLKNELFNTINMEIEYTGAGIKFTRFEIMDI